MYSHLGKFKRLFWRFFPPDSAGELFFRSLYYRFCATKVYTRYIIRKSEASYPEFIKVQDNLLLNQGDIPGDGPEITFFLPVMAGQSEEAIKTILSIAAQRITHWRLLIHTGSNNIIGLDDLVSEETQERVEFIQAPGFRLGDFTVRCKTEYFVCCYPGDKFSEYFIGCYLNSYQTKPGSAVYYSDNDLIRNGINRPLPHFKPVLYSPELHISTNYLSRSIISMISAQKALVEINQESDFLIQEWELLLLVCRENQSIIHIPWVLVHETRDAAGNLKGAEELFRRYFSRMGFDKARVTVERSGPHLKWMTRQPLVSIIIPTKNQLPKLKKLLESIFSLTEYPHFEIILVDNASSDPAAIPFYTAQATARPVRWIEFNETFNYSKANNLGAAHANGELLLFINNDMEVQHPDWLSELTQWALVPEIGAVGTKLIRPDRSIQHAGLVMGIHGSVGHIYLNAPESFHGLLGSVDWYRNVSAITGACQIFRKDVFELIGRYDEGYQLVFSDVEICLRLIKQGYRILYNPYAAIIHYEGASRGIKTPKKDIIREYEQMDHWLKMDDPYFSPNLTYTPIPACYYDPGHLDHRIAHMRARLDALTRDG